jgi:hypothetical protein
MSLDNRLALGRPATRHSSAGTLKWGTEPVRLWISEVAKPGSVSSF